METGALRNQGVHKIFTKKISTHLLTVLIIGAIVQIEQRKRNKKQSSESGVENVDNTQEQSESA